MVGLGIEAQVGPGITFAGYTPEGRPLVPLLRQTIPSIRSDKAPHFIGASLGLHPSLYYRTSSDEGTEVTLWDPQFPVGHYDVLDKSAVRFQLYHERSNVTKEATSRQKQWHLHELSAAGYQARQSVR